MKSTPIEWADYSWSPWWGCTPVSPGCAHCYAAAWSKWTRGLEYKRGVPRERIKDWKRPLTLNRLAQEFRIMRCPKCGQVQDARSVCRTADCLTLGSEMDCVRYPTVFPSMCDPFDEEVPEQWRSEFFSLMGATPCLTWLVLTKRPAVAAKVMGTQSWPNVAIGTSTENQDQAEVRIPHLLKITGALFRFVSAEPLLGEVNLDKWLWRLPEPLCEGCPKDVNCDCCIRTAKENGLASIDWVIVGGESGRKARACNVEDFAALSRQVQHAEGTALFQKQLGAVPMLDNGTELKLKDKKGGDPSEWPFKADRQFPAELTERRQPKATP